MLVKSASGGYEGMKLKLRRVYQTGYCPCAFCALRQIHVLPPIIVVNIDPAFLQLVSESNHATVS